MPQRWLGWRFEFPELKDWPELAINMAEDICRLKSSFTVLDGNMKVPILLESEGNNAYVIVHPFWSLDKPSGILKEVLEQLPCTAKLKFINTFEASRRLLSAINR